MDALSRHLREKCHEHYAEEFDPDKEYERGTFWCDFGLGLGARPYRWYCTEYTVSGSEPKRTLIAVTAQEQLSQLELMLLAPYCQCPRHTGPWPSRLLECGCCVGCLENSIGAPSAYSVSRARAARDEQRSIDEFMRSKRAAFSHSSCTVC